MLLLFLVIHLVLCLVLYLLIWLGALKCGKMAFMLVLLVPVWGAVCLVIQEIRARGKQQIREEVGRSVNFLRQGECVASERR